MGKRAAVIVAVGLLVASTTGRAGATGPDAAPTPTLTATPDTNLVDGQQVTASGDGWDRHAFYSIEQCADGTVVTDHCHVVGGAPEPPDSSGHLSFTVSVRTIVHADAGDFDCRTVGCLLHVTNVGIPDRQATANLAFDPSGTIPPPPTLAVTPASGILDGDLVSFSGSGFEPGAILDVEQCPPGDVTWQACQGEVTRTRAFADANGDVSGQVNVLALIPDAFADSLDDCRAVACTLAAFDPGVSPRPLVAAALGFDPDGALRPALEISVDPHDHLDDGQSVHVQVRNLSDGEVGEVVQCWHNTDDLDVMPDEVCDYDHGALVTGTAGPVSTDLVVRLDHSTLTPLRDRLDLRCDAAHPCTVKIDATGTRVATAPISFSTGAEPIALPPRFTG